MTGDTMTDVRAAVREVVPRLVALVRNVPDTDAHSIGTWTVGDVAAHLCHAFGLDTGVLAGRPVPEAVVTAAGMAEFNAKMLAEDGERDPAEIADRLEALAEEFDEVASSSQKTVDWLQGTRLPASAPACHLLEECLIHGHDIAAAIGRPWPVSRRHALLAIEGGVFPLIDALPPGAFVDQEKAFRGRFELRLRGGGRRILAFDNGSLTLDDAGAWNVDAWISAEAWALMLVFIGRQSIGKPVLGGQIAAWGFRPWKLVPMLTAMSAP